MPFGNPIVAGDTLIRNAIQSENYSDVDPVAGWQINRDGSATFNNLNTRGNASGPNAAYDNVSANKTLLYKGDELQTLLDNKAGGIVAYHLRTSSTPSAALNVYQAVARLNFTAKANKVYRITVTGHMGVTGGSGGPQVWDIRLKYAFGANPTFTSLDLRQCTPNGFTGGIPCPYTIDFLYRDTVDRDTRLLLCFFGAVGNGTTWNTIGSTILPTELKIVELTSALPFTGVDDNGAATPPTVYKTFDIQPYASRSYQGNGAALAAGNGNALMYQGDIGVDGNRRSWCWFDANNTGGGNGLGSINDMQGAVSLSYFDVYLYYPHWYNMSGGTSFIGHHNNNVVTNTEQGGGAYGEVTAGWPGRNVGQWVSLLGSGIATAAVAGTVEGITIGNTGSASLTQYGYAYGANGINGQQPGLRAGYTK